MKTLKDVLTEIQEGVSTTKSGKKKKTFSRTDYDKVVLALVNETDYELTTVGTKGGAVVENTTNPVKEFRSNIKNVLLDYGVDKQEAETVMTSYQFRKMAGLYGIASASIMEYCGAGKKFDFPTQRDFKGSITIDDVPETTKEYKSIVKPGDNKPQETFNIRTSQHKTLKSSSKAPSWLKNKF